MDRLMGGGLDKKVGGFLACVTRQSSPPSQLAPKAMKSHFPSQSRNNTAETYFYFGTKYRDRPLLAVSGSV